MPFPSYASRWHHGGTRRARTAVLLVVLSSTSLTACATSWKVQDAPPAEVVRLSGGDEVRISTSQQAELILRDAAVESDSLVGWTIQPVLGAPVPSERLAVALDDVRSIAVRRPDAAGNVFIGGLLAFATFTVTVTAMFVINCASGCD